jgi:hypothetical protein
MKKLYLFAFVFLTIFASPKAYAYESEAGAAARLLGSSVTVEPDGRAAHLRSFLKAYNSPLAGDAHVFIEQADKLGLDWRLLPAIAGVESTFGKFIPQGSYNGWGWGIPTGSQSGIAFSSWEDAIRTISAGLKENYVDKGAVTIEQMGRIYAASPAWSYKVHYFIHKIDTFVLADPEQLAISL